MEQNQTYPTIYTPKDIQTIFRCGRKKSYEIMNTPGFPSFRINDSLYVEKGELEKWISRLKQGRATTPLKQ